MSKDKSNIKTRLDSVANALPHLKEYDTETRNRIMKALQIREIVKKDFGRQIVQLV